MRRESINGRGPLPTALRQYLGAVAAQESAEALYQGKKQATIARMRAEGTSVLFDWGPHLEKAASSEKTALDRAVIRVANAKSRILHLLVDAAVRCSGNRGNGTVRFQSSLYRHVVQVDGRILVWIRVVGPHFRLDELEGHHLSEALCKEYGPDIPIWWDIDHTFGSMFVEAVKQRSAAA